MRADPLFLACMVGTALAACTMVDYAGSPHCYKDPPTEPILPWLGVLTTPSQTLTPQSCYETCVQSYAGQEITLVGVEGGLVCTCGNVPRMHLPAEQSTGCDLPCPGDGSKICGGSNALMSLYMCQGTAIPNSPGGNTPPTPGGNPSGPSGTPGSPPAKPSKAKPGGIGFSDIIGIALLSVLALLILGWVAALLVFVFALKKEGPERVPARGAIVGVKDLVSDGVGFVGSTLRGFTRRGSYDEK